MVPSARLSQVPLLSEDLVAQSGLFPAGQLDQDLQQIDLRGRNSWRLLMADDFDGPAVDTTKWPEHRLGKQAGERAVRMAGIGHGIRAE